jgi:circadian clock protein KaiC
LLRWLLKRANGRDPGSTLATTPRRGQFSENRSAKRSHSRPFKYRFGKQKAGAAAKAALDQVWSALTKSNSQKIDHSRSLAKTPTGIQGLDEVCGGGLPRGRPTLVCGGAGCGKTLLAMEFLVRGVTQYGEPGVFMAFEETARELTENVRSLGFHLDDLVDQKKIVIDFVRVERNEIEETGEYDLEALFIRLGHAIDSIKAKRVVLDTIETLFSGLSNAAIVRAELRRLFRWLKDKNVTAIVTGERGDGTLTRHGLEEYVSDCVILLDHRVNEQVSTRRLRIVKYRGSAHGTNEFPFLIDESGFSVLPISSVGLKHGVSSERVSTGIARLDAMLGGEGVYRGSSVLISGAAGTGKTSLAAHFADASGRRGERSLFFAFEESPAQLVRNLGSIGMDLEPWVKKNLLRFHASRPTNYGLEMHLATMHKEVREFEPDLVVIDPITDLASAANFQEAGQMLVRLMDFLKARQITSVFTSLVSAGSPLEPSEANISSLIDTWISFRDIEVGGERNRGMYILKSRGMAHSNQIREFLLSDRGFELLDAYLGPEGVLTGSARLTQEATEKAGALVRRQEIEGRQRDMERRREALEARIAAMRKEFEVEVEEARRRIGELTAREEALEGDRQRMAARRQSDNGTPDGSRTRSRKTTGGRQ